MAWLRVASAAVVLILVSPGALHRWTRPQLLAAAVFGIATALMNTFFFMGLARTDLGKSVAIEFIGPIAVAAGDDAHRPQRRGAVTRRFGVVVLGGLEVGDNTIGLLWILAASAMWALYIVIGSRIAQLGRGVAGLGIGLAIGAVAITPIGAPGSADVFTTPVARRVRARGRVLQRHRLRHRPARAAAHSGATLLGAARPPPGHRRGVRMDRPRSGALTRRVRRHRPRPGRRRPARA